MQRAGCWDVAGDALGTPLSPFLQGVGQSMGPELPAGLSELMGILGLVLEQLQKEGKLTNFQ